MEEAFRLASGTAGAIFLLLVAVGALVAGRFVVPYWVYADMRQERDMYRSIAYGATHLTEKAAAAVEKVAQG